MQIKKAAKTYADEYAKLGESVLKQKLADGGIEDEDIDQIIDKIKEGDTMMPADIKHQKAAAKIEAGNANSEFEEWKVALKSQQHRENIDENFDKVRRVKNVRIPVEMAEQMNEMSVNTNIRYFAV
ncbi:MAG: hypothetical protein EPN37_07165 [Chitinophagaceae bacterium]|nr:MAG: hypothetical protein EPN37_07165 [Chitinophagaceae bacterium]